MGKPIGHRASTSSLNPRTGDQGLGDLRGIRAMILQAENLRGQILGQDTVGSHRWRQSHPKTQASVFPQSHCSVLKVSIATLTAKRFINVHASSMSSAGRICKHID